MASSPITLWQIWGEKGKQWWILFSWASKSLWVVTATMKLQTNKQTKHLLLWRKGVPNLDNILKSSDITLPTKVYTVKAVVFPVVMYRCESCTIKKDEHWGADSFKLWSWTLACPLDSEEIKSVNPEGNWPWIFIRKTDAEAGPSIFWPPDAKGPLLEKTLMLGKTESKRRRGWQRLRWLDGVTDSVDMNVSKLWEVVGDRGAWRVAVHGAVKSRTRLSDWTTTAMREGRPSQVEGLAWETVWYWK